MPKRLDINSIVGRKYNKLTIKGEGVAHITKGGYIHRTVIVECDCGIVKQTQISSVLNGTIKSCGCHSREMASKRMKSQSKHGMHLSPEYNTWRSMKKRCLNKTHKSYDDYGGRGITICKEWVNSFENFFRDMGNRPSTNHSLDRIDNNKGYYKENCRWATKQEQCRNQRSNRLITYNGVTKCVAEWIEILGISRYELTK